jgi:hypothetical protein
MRIEVTYGQDTACYYTETIDMPVGMTEEEIRVFLRNRATKIAYDEDGPAFEPEYDFSNLRVVIATDPDGNALVDNMGVGPRYQDAGLLLFSALRDENSGAFLEAAGECGIAHAQAVTAIQRFAEFFTALAEENPNG